MPAFQYIAVNDKGTKDKGVIEADSLKQARYFLRSKGLIPLEVTITHEKKIVKNNKKIFNKQKITSKELSLITRQMATLFAAGLPIGEVLTAVAEQTEKAQTKSLLFAVRSKVLEGHTLYAALKEFPYAFSNLYCGTVAAGEKSGHLDKVLQRLADYTEQQYAIQQKIMHALIYPSIMICLSIGIVSFLLAYVVPKMIAVYNNMHETLPLLTQILLNISFLLQKGGVYFLLFLIILAILFRWQYQKNVNFRTYIQQILLRLPVLGKAIRTINTARFSRTFAILAQAGVPVLDAINISAALVTIIPIRLSLLKASERVREGAAIHFALKQTNYFPPMSVHLIASGETSGQLENMLERAANNQEQDITYLIETALALFEPAIIVIMGTIVLFIVLAVLLPIFQLDQFG